MNRKNNQNTTLFRNNAGCEDVRALLARLEDPTGEGRVTLLPREIKGLDLTESAWPFCPAA